MNNMHYMIYDMLDDMCCELKYAKRYYHKALNLKQEYPEVARKYINIAKEELSHASLLYELTLNLSKELKDEVGFIKEKHCHYITTYDELSYKLSKFML